MVFSLRGIAWCVLKIKGIPEASTHSHLFLFIVILTLKKRIVLINTNTMKNLILLCIFFLVLFKVSTLSASALNDKAFDTSLFDNSNEFFPSFSGPLLGLDDTLKYKIDDCGAVIDVCINIPIADISNYQITNNGQPYANGISGCNFDTLNLYNYTSLFGQGALGPYILQSWNISGSIFSAPFNSIDELVDSMNVWDPTGNWTHDDPNNEITGGTPGNTYSDMVIWSVVIGSSAILTRMDEIDTQGTSLNFGLGINEVVVTDNVNGGSESVVIQIACLSNETINAEVLIGISDTFCLDFTELLGDISTVTNLCTGSNVQFQVINSDNCVEYTGLSVGVDTACIEACDVFGFCDTTYLIVNIQPLAGIHEFYDTTYVSSSNSFCINTSVFPGTPDTIYNICPSNSGLFASFTLDENNFCVNYTGLDYVGTDLACIVVCDDTNVCDTTMMYITVKRAGPDIFLDTILINENTSYCVDTTNLDGDIVSMSNDCPGLSGTNVFFDLDLNSLCVNYEGIGVGKDTACIHLQDDMGNLDTTFMYVCVITPPTSFLYDDIRLGLAPDYCIDTTQLFGNIISIENVCPASSGTNVLFTIDNATFCVEAEAIAIGIDTACIVICDDLGVCDTTVLIITVEEDNSDIPVAVDDSDAIDMNTEMQIDVCANDTIPQNLPLTNFFVLPVSLGGIGPINGNVFSNNDCTVNYVPDNDYCGVDSFTYVICNMFGCDTANVAVTIICPPGEFRVFNGFSPNGDGKNDTFKVNGLENFPNHELFIYNRWGTQVYTTKNYSNDWGGNWEGNDLPDGTYFYVIKNGEGETFSGYVLINR